MAERIINQSISKLKNVGEKRTQLLNRLGIYTISDILFFFPKKYLDRSTILTSDKVENYIVNGYEGEVTIIGKVVSSEIIRYTKKQILKVQFKDKYGFFEAVWFNGIKFYKNRFKEGDKYALSAKPNLTRYGHLQFAHPDFDKIESTEITAFYNTGKIIPFYSIPKEIKEGSLGDASIRKIVQDAVENYLQYIEESIPDKIIEKNKLLNIVKTLYNIHFPQSDSQLHKAKERLKFEELFYLEILIQLKRNKFVKKIKGNSLKVKSKLIAKFIESLNFELTQSQLDVLHSIRLDMESEVPMNRLLQGDVGSGKTVVALISMLIAVDNGFQTVLIAPTEILANQHYDNIQNLLKAFDINISILLGGQKKKDKLKTLSDIEENRAEIIIGTHALLEENVKFSNLGLVVIDEQHRFGVLQRSKLIEKGKAPEVLIMTATPIPRTLSMTLYGDLDLSIIKELPQNRLPIKTYLRGNSKLPDVYKFIIDKISEGYQSYIVYPLVEESEKVVLRAAETYYRELKATYFKNFSVGLIHGKMNWLEKKNIMKDFSEKKYDILISTTVIEVGIDVPSANIIIINDAHRFGLSQLHQLRGRVGRGDKQAYCILTTDENIIRNIENIDVNFEYLSTAQIEKLKSQIRLNAMIRHSSGFKLAEVDFKLRGPGNIFGTEQSGLPSLKFADITEDYDLLANAKEEAAKIVGDDINLYKEENKIIKDNLKKHYSKNITFFNIA